MHDRTAKEGRQVATRKNSDAREEIDAGDRRVLAVGEHAQIHHR